MIWSIHHTRKQTNNHCFDDLLLLQYRLLERIQEAMKKIFPAYPSDPLHESTPLDLIFVFKQKETLVPAVTVSLKKIVSLLQKSENLRNQIMRTPFADLTAKKIKNLEITTTQLEQKIANIQAKRAHRS